MTRTPAPSIGAAPSVGGVVAAGRAVVAVVTATVVGAAAVVAAAEVHAWRVSRSRYPRTPAEGPADGRDVVLVLGYRSRDDGRINALQAWRVRIALRSAPPGALFVVSGAAVHGRHAEAEIMAEYAIAHGGIPASDIVRERSARSTRENISRSLPWLREARTIRIASNTSHARRGRGYLREIAPELFPRLRRTRDFLPLEIGPLRLALTVYDAVAAVGAARADRRDRRPPAPHTGRIDLSGPTGAPGRRSSL